MAREFGWAYVVGSQASGPKGSIQLAGIETGLDHDPNLVWSDELNALVVSGNIIAKNFEIQNETKTVTNLDVYGSSNFGDTIDDIHTFTGSLYITGVVHADSFVGWAGEAEGVAVNYYTEQGDYRLITSNGLKSIKGEENLTFDGTTLRVVGDINSTNIFTTTIESDVAWISDLTSDLITSTTLTDGTVVITKGNISGVDNFDANTLGGTLTTATQPNITSVGILTSLNVSGDVNFEPTFYVKNDINKVGVNVQDPQTTTEIKSTTTQLRLTSQREIFGLQSAQHTDLFTDTTGKFSISPTSGFVGINNTNPTVALDVVGDGKISGNLVIEGSLTARMTDFNVSADTLTFGDQSTDVVIFNAQEVQAPNGLKVNETLYTTGDLVGIGDWSTGSKLEITSETNQFAISNGSNKLSISADNSSISLSSTVGALSIFDETKIENSLSVASNSQIVLMNEGQVSSSISVSSDAGYFNNLNAFQASIGGVLLDNTNIVAGNVGAQTLGGTITTAAQPNITSVGTLNSLSVSGDATFSLDVLKIDSINKRVGVSKLNPQKKVEIKDTNSQLRLTNTDYVFGLSEYKWSDLFTNAFGDLSLMPSSGKVIAPKLNLTNVAEEIPANNFYLGLDSNGNVVKSAVNSSPIEIRNRTVVTSNYSVTANDYFIGINANSNLTIQLPSASSLQNGQIMILKDEARNADIYDLIISAAVGQQIDGLQQVKLSSPGSSMSIYTDGISNFFIF